MYQHTFITITQRNGEKKSFSVYALARWFSLIEAINYIDEYATNHNKPFNEFKSPMNILNYINAKQPFHEEKLHKLIDYCGFVDDRLFNF